jgi:tRNA dimethylallyltransferase
MNYNLDSILDSASNSAKNIIAVVGPTCTGKSDLAIELAKHLNAEIINADSRLIFKEMNIGTAKPSESELSEVKHHLVNIKRPDESYSAAEYQSDFDQIIESAPENQKFIVVGGTGFYLKAALANLNMPKVSTDPELREELAALELDVLRARMLKLDPEAGKQVDLDNKIRLIRAIEICELSGETLAKVRSFDKEDRYDVHYIGLTFEKRRELYDLINKRVINMIKNGLVHEVEALVKKYGATQTMNGTIGYKEIIMYLEGKYESLNAARRAIQLKTRRYAKKQLTWFRQNEKVHWYLR